MPNDLVLPSHDDPVATELAHGVGGPVGRHARVGAGGFWTPLRVVLAFVLVTVGVGWAIKAPCRRHAWSDGYQYTRMCYSDVHALYFAEGLNEGKVPYRDHPVEYPVVIGGVMYVVSAVVDSAVRFYDVTALLLLVCALVAVAATVGVSGRRPWDAALFALAPGLALHATTNWDLVAVAFASLGLLAWSRRRPGLAGIWWGLGTATKLYPLLFFGPLLLLCLRARRMREFATSLVAAAATWSIVNYPVWEAHPKAWGRFYELNRSRGADWDSLHYLFQKLVQRRTSRQFSFDLDDLNKLVAVAFLLACVGIAVLALRAPRRPRLPQLLFLTVAAFLLVNKVNSPQYTLWLIPLAVLARPRWGAFLTWQFLELGVMFTRFYMFLGQGSGGGISELWFFFAILLRDAALVAVMLLVVREIRYPEEDVVRRDGVDDPAGGVLDGAPDALHDPDAPDGPRPLAAHVRGWTARLRGGAARAGQPARAP